MHRRSYVHVNGRGTPHSSTTPRFVQVIFANSGLGMSAAEACQRRKSSKACLTMAQVKRCSSEKSEKHACQGLQSSDMLRVPLARVPV